MAKTSGTNTEVVWRPSYGPVQLRDLLGLPEWQIDRLRGDKRFPDPDLPNGRWSQDLAQRLYRRRRDLARSAGSVPDVGSFRAAEYLADRFATVVSPDTVAELARVGHLGTAGTYKGRQLYCGRSLERFDDRAVLDQAEVDGRLLNTDAVVEHLGVRPVDVGYLVDKGYLTPVDFYQGQWNSQVPLYRVGDLIALLRDDRFNWDAVRSLPRGARSPFAELPTVERSP